jgi:PLP dependent protein
VTSRLFHSRRAYQKSEFDAKIDDEKMGGGTDVIDILKIVESNLAEVRDRIATCASTSGRTAVDVTLVGVCKYFGSDITRIVVEAGCRDVGENRPQTLWSKASDLSALNIRFHQIGHLQRNKVRRTINRIDLLHAGDSLRLINAVSKESVKQEIVTRLLIEVNVSGDRNKEGFRPTELESVLEDVANLPNIDIQGLMSMSGLESDESQTTREFALLRELREGLTSRCPENVSLKHLSMGMTRDYELAIREGATIVRIGTALFEGIPRV